MPLLVELSSMVYYYYAFYVPRKDGESTTVTATNASSVLSAPVMGTLLVALRAGCSCSSSMTLGRYESLCRYC